MLLFKEKIRLIDLANIYCDVIKFIMKNFNISIDNSEMSLFLIDLYCCLYMGTFENLSNLISKIQIINFEKMIISSFLNTSYISSHPHIEELEKRKDFVWNFLSQKHGTILFIEYKLENLGLTYNNDVLYNFSTIILNNINGINKYMKTIKIF